LAVHLTERCEELIKDGLEPADAAQKVIERMGDPLALGARIAKANASDKGIIALWGGILLAVAVVLFMVLASGGYIRYILDLSTLLCIVLLSTAYALAASGGKFTAVIFLRNIQIGSLYAALVCIIISFISILSAPGDPPIIGKGISITLIAPLYAVLLSAGARAAVSRLAAPEPGSIAKLLDE
jgi:hypothetical protein